MRWIAFVFVPGDHPDLSHAIEAAELIYGDDVFGVQSEFDWRLDEDRLREQRPDNEEDGA